MGSPWKTLKDEYKKLLQHPLQNILVQPDEEDAFNSHIVFEGPSETPFAQGYYYVTIRFSATNSNPPNMKIHTRNGRFQVDHNICVKYGESKEQSGGSLDMTGMLLSLYEFLFYSDEPTAGAVLSTDEEKAKYANESVLVNLCNDSFCNYFCDLQSRFKEERGITDEQVEEKRKELKDKELARLQGKKKAHLKYTHKGKK